MKIPNKANRSAAYCKAPPQPLTARERRELETRFVYEAARNAGYRYRASEEQSGDIATPTFDAYAKFSRDAKVMRRMQRYKRKLLRDQLRY